MEAISLYKMRAGGSHLPGAKAQMKIGYQALFDFNDAFSAVEFGIEHGFNCVELNQINPAFLPEKYSSIQRERLKNYLFPILIHAPEALSLFNTHKRVLDAILERIYEIIEFGNEIGAKGITLHLGATFSISVGGKMQAIHNILTQEYEDTLKYALLKLAEYADKKVRLSIENTSGFRYEISRKVLKEILPSKNLWLTWDIGHTNKIGKDKAVEEEFFLKFIEKINEVHLHDNHGKWDEHAVIGTGTVDFKHYFELLEPIDPYFIIEVRPRERALEAFEVLKKSR